MLHFVATSDIDFQQVLPIIGASTRHVCDTLIPDNEESALAEI
jgi:hypothetical protein